MSARHDKDGTATYSAGQRAELLAAADTDALVALAEALLGANGDDLRVLAGPELGMVMLQVREPVAEERFYLTEVLVSRAEVELRGSRGWAMRAGDDGLAALAAAVLDAVADAETETDHLAAVEALCASTAARLSEVRAAELAELAPTTVQFAELDR